LSICRLTLFSSDHRATEAPPIQPYSLFLAKVEEGGIRYARKVYAPLSGMAMAAAKDLGLKNKTQNGYIFWGLITPPRPASDPIVGLERAWERYRERAEALVREGVTEENRSRVAASLGKHAQLIEKLGGSSTLKGASAK